MDAVVLRAVQRRMAPVGAIMLARDLDLPWQTVARSLKRLAASGRIVAKTERIAVSYRWGGEIAVRYSAVADDTYPEWLLPRVRLANGY